MFLAPGFKPIKKPDELFVRFHFGAAPHGPDLLPVFHILFRWMTGS
jgi:hypothetical protein